MKILIALLAIFSSLAAIEDSVIPSVEFLENNVGGSAKLASQVKFDDFGVGLRFPKVDISYWP
jgi:hypothetical protein